MAKNLVIVESPAKARTIARYLGSDFKTESTYGHIRDLPKNELGVDIPKGFKPKYQISPDKQNVATNLKKVSKNHQIWLATDEDREGEAIAWHVCHILDINPAQARRIVFHEITKPAISQAVKNPRSIDTKLVDAQQARRILDRLVGYELSPVLWKKVRQGLSAGRVQSVAVRLIVEREQEIGQHKPESSFKVTAVFIAANKDNLAAELDQKLKDEPSANSFLQHAHGATFSVGSVEQKPTSRNPNPPFTTSTLQQEAGRRLGLSIRQTMTLAQRLYEHGHITYMRTDSLTLSTTTINSANKYIVDNYGAKYSHSRSYKTDTKLAQEAHEAIRPTNFKQKAAGADAKEKKLYDLIWRRALASQMAPAQTDRTEIKIKISGRDEQFVATGEVLRFDGFMKVYGGSKEDQILPPLKEGEKLKLESMLATQVFSRPPARYSEGTLVKKMEELGIGRPSTYAPIINTVQRRGYIEKKDSAGESQSLRELQLKNGRVVSRDVEVSVGAERAKLVPTDLADIVTKFLIEHFASIVDYEFTAKAEEELDDIARGRTSWQAALKRFYGNFHPLVKKSQTVSRSQTLQVRKLGTDSRSGQPVYARFGRYGPVLQLGDTPKEDDHKKATKPRFAPLPAESSLDKITLDEALPMFELPREVGKMPDGQTITADVGRYGPYLKVGQEFTTLRDHDPLQITEKQAREVIKKQRAAKAARHIAEFGDIKILRGPYGPYVTDGQRNARIPKKINPEKLTEAQAKNLLEKKDKRTAASE